MQSTNSFGQIYDSTVHDFIDSKHQQLAEILHDYDPTLSLEFIPSMERDETDSKPFRIKQTPADTSKAPYIVRYLSVADMSNPAQVLEWVWEGDFKKHNPDAIFDRLEARRIAQELTKKKDEMAEREAQIDLMANLAGGGRDKKFFYKHNGQTFRR